ncbi:MAG: NUDIX domain-containing protein [Desulfobacteraceae bacterium]
MHHHNPEFHFCPVCGGPVHAKCIKWGEPERLVCSACDFVLYLDPKVVSCTVLETEGNIVLLKRAIKPQSGKWVLPGGYVDRGEPVPQAAVREAQEECGLEIRIKRLLGVYSYPGKIPVVIVYIAEAVGGAMISGDETREAKMFSEATIPWQNLAFQSTTDALRDYFSHIKTHKNNKGDNAKNETDT